MRSLRVRVGENPAHWGFMGNHIFLYRKCSLFRNFIYLQNEIIALPLKHLGLNLFISACFQDIVGVCITATVLIMGKMDHFYGT